jgi:NAD(P)-dependent dehydrogenase (short-subunit alcohol dehydrogenase family)
MTFRDKVTLITGAASGIGRALSTQMAAEGAKVIMADVDAEGLEAAASSIRANGRTVETIALDVADAPKVEQAIAGVFERHGRLDYLFNNAGIGGPCAETQEIALQEWKRVLAVNLDGVVHGVVSAYPRMVKQGFGHIINTASMAGLVPCPLATVYGTTKHAVVGLSSNLRVEGKGHGVRVSVVCPGHVATPIYERSTTYRGYTRAELRGLMPPAVTPEYCARVILRGVRRNRRIILVTKVAYAVWFLYRFSTNLTLALTELAMARLRRLASPARTEAKAVGPLTNGNPRS